MKVNEPEDGLEPSACFTRQRYWPLTMRRWQSYHWTTRGLLLGGAHAQECAGQLLFGVGV